MVSTSLVAALYTLACVKIWPPKFQGSHDRRSDRINSNTTSTATKKVIQTVQNLEERMPFRLT